MDESEFLERLRIGVGGPDLWYLRETTALHTTQSFVEMGRVMANRSDLADASAQAVRTMGYLLQMAGELGFAASRMLSEKEHYAGAALLRQIVEIEYLTWTFKEGHKSVADWLSSTYEERMKLFSPGRLRANSKGRFLFKDYQDHCEQGGHPVPRGIPLLGGQNVGSAQILLVDLLTHCWRTWDQIRNWLTHLDNAKSIDFLESGIMISKRLSAWGASDPIYILMVEWRPEPEAHQ